MYKAHNLRRLSHSDISFLPNSLSDHHPSVLPCLDFNRVLCLWPELKHHSHKASVCGRLHWRFVAMREEVLYPKIKQQSPWSQNPRDPCPQKSFGHFSLVAILQFATCLLYSVSSSLSSLSCLLLKLQLFLTSSSSFYFFIYFTGFFRVCLHILP